MSTLRYWNNIYGNKIRVGQKLTVYVPGSKYEQLKAVDQMSFAQKQRMIGKSTARKGDGSPQKAGNNILASGEYIYYTVKSGDNLWEIARKYPGTSNQDIMRINGMKSSSLKPGQRIKIKPKDG